MSGLLNLGPGCRSQVSASVVLVLGMVVVEGARLVEEIQDVEDEREGRRTAPS
jgi:hypothetical protein